MQQEQWPWRQTVANKALSVALRLQDPPNQTLVIMALIPLNVCAASEHFLSILHLSSILVPFGNLPLQGCYPKEAMLTVNYRERL